MLHTPRSDVTADPDGVPMGGLVHQVNRISRYHVVETLHEGWPTIPVTATIAIPHIVYHFDQDIPAREIPTTGVFRARRV
ncbi:MAG: hypothetical protein ACRDO2_04270 [Nocardioidaceae bacterium]